ncbi:hypothetical protein [Litorilituus sediminis]|uniref:hypothetical protein n=1 Tax=Litorilituus sediminis TaxID=718192 RepID=UPI0014777FA6|nr:hypothetical protein [Litorilituus sediminis]
MEWIQGALLHEPVVLFALVFIIFAIFIFAARRAHLNHVERMRKIDETFNPRESFHRKY